MNWRDRECPTNPRDAYYEGRRSREFERNPYEHGREFGASRDCEEAHREWQSGHRQAEYAREEAQAEERAEQRRIEARREQARHEQWAEEEARDQEQRRIEEASCPICGLEVCICADNDKGDGT